MHGLGGVVDEHRFSAVVRLDASVRAEIGGRAGPARCPTPLRAGRADITVGQVEADHAGAVVEAGTTDRAVHDHVARILRPLRADAGKRHRRQKETVLVALQLQRRRADHAKAVVETPAAVYEEIALPKRRRAAPAAVVLEAIAIAVEERGVEREAAPRRRFPESTGRHALLTESLVAAFGLGEVDLEADRPRQAAAVDLFLVIRRQGGERLRRDDAVAVRLFMRLGIRGLCRFPKNATQ